MIIGGPVSHREWIMNDWYDHVEVAAKQAGVEPHYLHVGDPRHDPDTWQIIRDRAGSRLVAVGIDETERPDIRDWTDPRYRYMADIRNAGLDAVRDLGPDYFLSLDSDILLHPDAIVSLLDAVNDDTQRWDAVGGGCFMTYPTTAHPSWGVFGRDGTLQRRVGGEGGLFKVDVIMAIKLMTPAAYAVDYRFDKNGEDIGWARGCRDAALALAWDGRVMSKHCFDRKLVTEVDKRLGW